MKQYKTKAYACYNKNDKVRRESTSGGLFFLIAERIIQSDGFVCGAVFDEQFNVKHVITNDIEQVKKMQGSKYPQSCLGSCFREIKEILQKGNQVLFCGTPCQAIGLKSFLGGNYSNLILLDFVCHGVGSPGLWDKYIETYYGKENLVNIRFKDKPYGWKNWVDTYTTKDRSIYKSGMEDLYMRSYLLNVNHRPSCYECNFKGIDRDTDFTIADCWGIGENDRELNDDNGLSAFLIHSELGNLIFDSIKNEIEFKEYVPEELMSGNWACVKSSNRSKKREEFFRDFKNNKDLKKVFKKHFSLSLKERIQISKRKYISIVRKHCNDKSKF